jgi:homoserine kinase type II
VPVTHLKMTFPLNELTEIMSMWGVGLKRLGDDTQIAGSPERTAFRTLVESDSGEFFVLEKVHRRDVAKKKRIAQTVKFLSCHGLTTIIPYRETSHGQQVCFYDDDFWQLVPFRQGVELDRTKYYFDAWRAPVMAEFLAALHKSSAVLPAPEESEIFNLKEYVVRILGQMEQHHPQVRETIVPVVNFLESEFMPHYQELPVAFCHGDYHPLNIIWGENSLLAVIDWEFCGFKPEIYDVANMVGCLGMENPECLEGPLVTEFIRRMKELEFISQTSWQNFRAFVVALRFGWLAEWLRKKDEPMIDLELDYMKLLICQRELIS